MSPVSGHSKNNLEYSWIQEISLLCVPVWNIDDCLLEGAGVTGPGSTHADQEDQGAGQGQADGEGKAEGLYPDLRRNEWNDEQYYLPVTCDANLTAKYVRNGDRNARRSFEGTNEFHPHSNISHKEQRN